MDPLRGVTGARSEAGRMAALVDLARGGHAEAFGLLHDHDHATVYRFLYYRLAAEQQECLVLRFLQGHVDRRDHADPEPVRGRGQAAAAARGPQSGQASARGIR